jgi:hypothetical protein
MPSDSLRAGQLATALPAARITLPAEVQAALKAHAAAVAMTLPAPPRPGALASAATAQAAASAVQAAAKTGTITLDPAPVAAARLAETEARDRAELARAVLDAATAKVCAAADRHAQALTTSIQARHAETVRDLATLAAQLPPGVNDDLALETGDPLRERYLRARDLTSELSSLSALLLIIWPDDRFTGSPGDLERAVSYLRDAPAAHRLYEYIRTYPEPGSLEFWLRLLREHGPDAAWCPRLPEAQARAAELAAQWREDRVLAGPNVWR